MNRFSLGRFLLAARSVARPAPRRQGFRLCLQQLDERVVPATLRVGASETYHTIQAAVTAASAGDKILVDPGTYQEQVTIPAADTVLTLRSTCPLAAVIKAPTVMTGNMAIVDDAGATNVTIDGFTITGPGGSANNSIGYGIRIDSGGSATIEENHITKIEDSSLGGDQTGIAIMVGRQSQSTTGSAKIIDNVIDNFQKEGILVSNTGSSAEIEGNIVRGVGPTAVIAQNGVQVSDGATAEIEGNVISGDVYSPQTFASVGIVLVDPGLVSISCNVVTTSDVGIYALGANGVKIERNLVAKNTFDGIVLDTTTGAVVAENFAYMNGSKNPGDGGIALVNSTNNVIKDNVSLKNQGVGIYVDSASTGNTIRGNKLRHNAIYDAEDDSTGSGTAGTGNTWEHNHGKTDNHGGALV
jgi:parallel beta-helix repeat protein